MARVALAWMLLVGPVVGVAVWSPVATAQDDTERWTIDLARLNAPYAEADGFTAMAVSADGRAVAAGLDNGGLLVFAAKDGEELYSAHTGDHLGVKRISLNGDGSRAAVVYEDGYLAVLDEKQNDPLLTLNSEPGGIPLDVRPRVAAEMTANGRFLMVTDDQVYLFREETTDGGVEYEQVGLSPENVGPFMYVHPRLPFFGALSAEGEVAIYSYGSSSLELVGEQSLELDEGERITAFGSSADGARFAIALSSGIVRRYLPQLGPSGGQLVLDYEDQILGRPRGVSLSSDGLRLVVWSERETLWTEGRNRNVPDEEATAADAATVRLKPPTFDQRFRSVDTSANLTRALTRFVGEGGETRLYNLPERDFFVVAEEAAAASGPSALDAAGSEVYRAAGTRLLAYRITEQQLAPPGLDQSDRTGADPSGDADDTNGVLGVPFTPTTALLAGGALLLVILLAVLLPLLLAARRGDGAKTLAPLAPETSGPVLPPIGAGGGASSMPPGVRAVAPSAPMTTAPPEGLLVMQDVSIKGEVALHGLTMTWRRPGVVTVKGERGDLAELARGLGAQTPVTGLVAVGGASAAETPMLFSRRIQIGIAPSPARGVTPDAAYHAEAATHRLPASLVERRINADLAWLGAKRAQLVDVLTPLDRWKLRLALAVIHRPHVVLLPVAQLPRELERDARVADAVGAVLRGVARHFQVLLLLLDDGGGPAAPLYAWSDEAVRLTPSGFQERTRLENGKPAAPPKRRRASRRGAGPRDVSP